ncbi:hypothetical protein MNBD_GAMMA10-1682 [hydrothermal vent metagenome]|uniref:Uncharacterized protein n=1 Tax=hydrothermal vent metagenome TaxID=652676 RepID=A0A3B0YUK6_9ZZZZ
MDALKCASGSTVGVSACIIEAALSEEVFKVDQQKKIEQMVLSCIDTAKAMLEEYEQVIPFGIRAFSDSDDLKMNCPADKNPQAGWSEQIDLVVSELRGFVSNDAICATALVTELESGAEKGLGVQVETELSSVLFVYPFRKQDDEWHIEEPVKTDQLLTTVYSNNST